MQTLRTVYGKILQLPQGTKLTTRQQDIMELCSFLKEYMSTRDKDSKKSCSTSNSSRRKTLDSLSLTPKITPSPLEELENLFADEDSSQKENVNSDFPKLTVGCQTLVSGSLTTTEMISTASQTTFSVFPLEKRSTSSQTTVSGELEKRSFGSQTSVSSCFGKDRTELRDHQPINNPMNTDHDRSEIHMAVLPFWRDCVEMMKNLVPPPTQFDIHECWGRMTAEKLKLLDPKKAEELKLQFDALLLQLYPDIE